MMLLDVDRYKRIAEWNVNFSLFFHMLQGYLETDVFLFRTGRTGNTINHGLEKTADDAKRFSGEIPPSEVIVE